MGKDTLDRHDDVVLFRTSQRLLNTNLTKYMKLCDDIVVGNEKIHDFLGLKKGNESFLIAQVRHGEDLYKKIS